MRQSEQIEEEKEVDIYASEFYQPPQNSVYHDYGDSCEVTLLQPESSQVEEASPISPLSQIRPGMSRNSNDQSSIHLSKFQIMLNDPRHPTTAPTSGGRRSKQP